MADPIETSKGTREKVAQYVRDLFEDAKAHKQHCVQGRIEDGINARLGYYNDIPGCGPSDNNKNKGDSDYITVNHLGKKMEGFSAMLKRVYADADDRVWTIDATPEPEIPQWLKLKAVGEAKRLLFQVGVPESAELERVMRQLKNAARAYWHNEGRVRNEAMTRLMEDQQEEGGFRLALNEFFHWLPSEPTATLKGPYPTYKMGLRYKGDVLEQGYRQVLSFQHLPAWTIFPSPDSTNGQDGSFMIHVERHCKRDLQAWIQGEKDTGFIPVALKAFLKEFEDEEFDDDTFKEINWHFFQKEDATDFERKELVDIVKCYVKISGRDLRNLGVRQSDARKFDTKKHYEAELWLAGDHLIFADADPSPLGQRPFHTYSFRRRRDQFWGQSVYDVGIELQRVINAAERSLVRNMAFSSSPFGTAIEDRFPDGVPEEIAPQEILRVLNDYGSGHDALRLHQWPSNCQELLKVMQYHSGIMDEVLEIPQTVHGGVPGGGVFRSGTSAAIYTNQANIPIEARLDDLDKLFFEPLMRQQYYWNMLYHPNDGVKFDAQVKARGVQGLRRLQTSAQTSVNNLQYLVQMAQSGLIPPQGVQGYVRTALDAQGIDADTILGPMQFGGQAAAAQAIGTEAGVQDVLSQLDGRSQPQVPTQPGI